MPSSLISIGSSIVVIFTSSLFKDLRIVYRVVVLPEPVGPEVKIIPLGHCTISWIFCTSDSSAPGITILLPEAFKLTAGARIRITTFSLPETGRVFIRKSYILSLYLIEKVPSCGRLCSAMFILARTLNLVITACSIEPGISKTFFKIPSERVRTT